MSDEMIRLIEQGYSFHSQLIKDNVHYKPQKEYILYFEEEEVYSKTAGIAEVFSFIEMVNEYKVIRREKILTELGI